MRVDSLHESPELRNVTLRNEFHSSRILDNLHLLPRLKMQVISHGARDNNLKLGRYGHCLHDDTSIDTFWYDHNAIDAELSIIWRPTAGITRFSL